MTEADELCMRIRSELIRLQYSDRMLPLEDRWQNALNVLVVAISKWVAEKMNPKVQVGTSFYGMPVPDGVHIPKPYVYEDTWRLFVGRW